jgi:hypothetical protein
MQKNLCNRITFISKKLNVLLNAQIIKTKGSMGFSIGANCLIAVLIEFERDVASRFDLELIPI